MKLKIFFLIAAAVMFLNAPSDVAAAETVTVVLNHMCPVQVNGRFEYEEVKEVGYVVAPNVIVTREKGRCNFFDDAILRGEDVNNVAAIGYLFDSRSGVKVFITEKALPVSSAPPEWTREYLEWATREIDVDGGDTKKIIEDLNIGDKPGDKPGEEMPAWPGGSL